MKRIFITGGHLTPALAVIPKLQEKGWEIVFVGRKYALEGEKTLSAEFQAINNLGIKFLTIYTGRLQRSFTRYTIFSLIKVPFGFFQSLYWLITIRPGVILSFGSYVALPVALAGWILRIPVITHEQSVVPGLATRIIAKVAKKICISWPETEEWFPKEKTILTGNPLREEIFEKTSSSNIKYPDDNLPLIYITGGSLGSHAINDAVSQILSQLLIKYRLVHQCGESQTFKDYEILNTKHILLSPNFQKRYLLTKYIGPKDIGWVMNNADLVISRSGANTVYELAALGKPAILIPLPWAGQKEQMENAKILEAAGTVTILTQEKLSGDSLSRTIELMMQKLENYKDNGDKVRKLVDFRATDRIVEVINENFVEKKG